MLGGFSVPIHATRELERSKMSAQNAAARFEKLPTDARAPLHIQRRANGDAVRSADGAHLERALASVSWRRRGFLQTLARD